MKRIFLKEEQIKYINNINKSLPQDYDTDLLFDDKTLTQKILAKRFLEVKEYFNDDIQNEEKTTVINQYLKILSICQKKEQAIKNQLESLCYNTLIELFNIPEGQMNITIELVDSINDSAQFHISPDTNEDYEYESIKAIDDEDIEVQKRRLTNIITCGATEYAFKESKSKYIEKLFDLDEELPHLYSKLMKLNEYLLFTTDVKITDKHPHQGGYSKITLGNDEKLAKIETKAITFPMLLFESIKGVLELIASNGLPDDIGEANNILNKADILEKEPSDMRLGEGVFNILTLNSKPLVSILPDFIHKLTALEANSFNDLIHEVLKNTKEGKRSIKELLDDCVYSFEYSKFNDDILKKQTDKSIIDDGFFTLEELDEENLDEANYPQTFNIQEFANIRSFAGRVKYCEQRLKRIAAGSARIVYQIDDNTVLKLAKNQKGIAQNQVEAGDPGRSSYGCFAEVYNYDGNTYQWLEMELAMKAKLSDFKRITGYDFRTFQYFVDWTRYNYIGARERRYGLNIPSQYLNLFKEMMEQDDFNETVFGEVYSYLSDYQLRIVGDIKRISSWGIVKRDWGEDLVMIDFGLDDDTFNEYYGHN